MGAPGRRETRNGSARAEGKGMGIGKDTTMGHR